MSIICSGQLVSLKGGRRNNDDCLFKRGQQLVYSAVQGRRNQKGGGTLVAIEEKTKIIACNLKHIKWLRVTKFAFQFTYLSHLIGAVL